MKSLKWSCFLSRIDRQDEELSGSVLFHSINRGVYYVPKEFMEEIDIYLSDNKLPSEEAKDAIVKLYHSGMLVDRDNNESTLTDRMRDEYYRQGIRSVFYFVPTWQCNFNCPYCIQHNTIHNQPDDQGTTMSLETARQCGKFMVEYAKQQATKELLICFYGGEPLLAPLVDLEMMKAVKELAGQDIRPDYILITNGTLIRENVILEMKAYGLNTVQITLDGPPKIHDKRRTYVNGRPSFMTIVDNIKKLHKWGLKVAVRVNIDSTNAKHITELIDILADFGIQHFAEIKFAPVDSWESSSEEIGHNASALQWFGDIYKRTVEKGFYTTFWESLCGIYGKSFFSIASDGKLYKCPSYTGIEEETVGDIYNGVNEHYYDFINRDIPSACKECRWIGICGGGCLYQKYLKSPDCNADYCISQTFESIMNAFFTYTHKQKVQSYISKSV